MLATLTADKKRITSVDLLRGALVKEYRLSERTPSKK